jgi:uncharacterized repeat protein (TIGR04076 family)
MEMRDVKITVLKRLETGDVVKEYGTDAVAPLCNRHMDGEEFLSEGMQMPEGFCNWAWADIQRDVVTLSLGGDFPWMKEKGKIISCCTDGLRPVLFKLERL